MASTPIFSTSRINLLLLINITLITYLSVFVSEFSSLDDTGLMEVFQKGQLTVGSFSPVGGGTYLRPLTMLSYLLDYSIWGANSAAFHMTNLIIHIANSCLIYQLCRTYLPQSAKREGLSLFVALFFALTPLNSESVLWVSGRTDILCCFFFIAAIIVLLNDQLSPWFAASAFFFFYFCSLLAKESSIALLGIVPLYLLFSTNYKTNKSKIALCISVAVASSTYFLMRLGPKAQLDIGAKKIVSMVINQTLSDLIYKSIAAIGFYIKKLLWPYPLNLAIQSINEPLYFFVGIISIIVIAACFIIFRTSRLPLLIIVFGLVPPLLAFHGNIPWTLYAERYLYIPMTGMVLLIGLLLAKNPRIPQLLPFLLIIPLGVSTINRSGQWADPVLLWQDTAKKSPLFPQAHVTYAYELIQVGRFDEAEAAISKARSLKFESELLLKCISSINNQTM